MTAVDNPVATTAVAPRFRKISGADDIRGVRAMHQGEGVIGIHRFAFFEGRQTPYFLMFDMPPGSSEGVHVHGAEDASEGWLDEYYFIVSGAGLMRIDGEVVTVAQGDVIYTPAGVSHGIENTAKNDTLKVMLTVIAVPPS